MSLQVSADSIREWLRTVPDPEIPHVSVVDMGMIGEIKVSDSQVSVELIPTFAGCPAIKLLQSQIQTLLRERGLEAKVEVRYDRPWRVEDMSPAGWQALRRAGFAIPKKLSPDPSEMLSEVSCPRCGSEAVSLSSPFGPTACRAIFRCHSCGEAFELFKPPL
ncbi:MAG: phenylacetate-CoA oxygenase subunit PaaJ [Bacteroidia bacterium]|nr:phenylacetate-CoA oxygenase subunit PaaJ [Bacteroidia bacterium]MCX7652034.1 phenylacetate-CoA oxygenase subunit PaaJ [Bacteroidia bacterium]MDW8416295.1 1,2-phenylacetyl-CoA epoxidase subunit PaaD [Bacteroidia bacterium]